MLNSKVIAQAGGLGESQMASCGTMHSAVELSGIALEALHTIRILVSSASDLGAAQVTFCTGGTGSNACKFTRLYSTDGHPHYVANGLQSHNYHACRCSTQQRSWPCTAKTLLLHLTLIFTYLMEMGVTHSSMQPWEGLSFQARPL